MTKRLPQARNDETTNLQEHTRKAKWDGLYSRYTVSDKSHQHGRGKSLTMINQPERKQQKWCQCGSINHLQVTSKDFPVGLAIGKAIKLSLGVGLSQYEAKKASEYSASE